jgi:thiamine-phosphate pyrophosphorylase
MGFSCIIITPPEKIKNEIRIVTELFENGLQHFHLRKPGYTSAELKAYIEKIPIRYHKYIVIHSHYKLIKEYGIKGIHLTEKAKKTSSVIAFIKGLKNKDISASFHSLDELKRSRKKYDSVFLSPVFESISKKGLSSGFTQELLKREIPILTKKNKLIALGGVHDKNVGRAKELGFDGIAVLGYIWESREPVVRFLRLQKALHTIR